MRELRVMGADTALNKIFAIDEEAYSANHRYIICDKDKSEIKCTLGKLTHSEDILETIDFQKGPRSEKDSIRGVTELDLLEIVKDRLLSFQKGKFACVRNEKALKYVSDAIEELVLRQQERKERDVLGKDEI